jgi:hypothetical protein
VLLVGVHLDTVLTPDAEIEWPQKNAKDTKRIGFEDFPSRRFCGLRFHHSRPLQKAALVVAAVCDRRRFPIISRPLGAHRAPLQGFCSNFLFGTRGTRPSGLALRSLAATPVFRFFNHTPILG